MLPRNEMIFLGLIGVALVGIVVFKSRGLNASNGVPVDVSQDTNDITTTGPAWLTYNQPWGYNPALGGVNYAVMPSRSVGQVGQVGAFGAQRDFSDCGCD